MIFIYVRWKGSLSMHMSQIVNQDPRLIYKNNINIFLNEEQFYSLSIIIFKYILWYTYKSYSHV